MSKNANSKNRTQNTYNSTNETGLLQKMLTIRKTPTIKPLQKTMPVRAAMTKTAITTLTTKTEWNKPLPLFYDTGAVPCCTCYFFT